MSFEGLKSRVCSIKIQINRWTSNKSRLWKQTGKEEGGQNWSRQRFVGVGWGCLMKYYVLVQCKKSINRKIKIKIKDRKCTCMVRVSFSCNDNSTILIFLFDLLADQQSISRQRFSSFSRFYIYIYTYRYMLKLKLYELTN